MSNSDSPSQENIQAVGQLPSSGRQIQYPKSQQQGLWQRKLILCGILFAFAASFFAYARRGVDFAGYAAVGQAFFDGRDIYLDTPVGTNTWPPFFSLAAVPPGGIALAAAAAMKVMAIAFLPYLLYRKRWRAAFWMAAASLVFFFSPALFLGWAKFWAGVGLWPVALRASWGAGNAHQSVYSMWDRILGYGYLPFTIPGTFMLPLSGARSAKLAWEITCAIAAVLGAIACRGTPQPGSRWAQLEWSIVFVAATILSPLTRKPYLVVLLLPYALLYAAWHSPDLDARTRRILRNVVFISFALSIPTMHDVIGKSLAVRLEMGSVVTYGSLIMLGGLLWYRSRAPREAL